MNVMCRVFLAASIASLSVVSSYLAPPRTATASEFYISDEISVDGPAIFFGVSGASRQKLWSVYCTQPMRGCMARSRGLVLRVDDLGNARLMAATLPGTRISILERNFSQDRPTLFAQQMDAALVDVLSKEDTFVVLEDDDQIVLHSPTTGIDRVIHYLSWLQSPTARTLRDARLWPRKGELTTQNMTPEVLRRYQIIQRRAVDAKRQLIPYTKPQIEFAIKAQGGRSFFGLID